MVRQSLWGRFGRDLLVGLAFVLPLALLAFVVGRQYGADWTPDDERVTVYVPLSPNPTLGGHLLAVRDERVTETSMSVRAALTVLVTVGAGESDESEPPLAGLYRERVEGSDAHDGRSV